MSSCKWNDLHWHTPPLRLYTYLKVPLFAYRYDTYKDIPSLAKKTDAKNSYRASRLVIRVRLSTYLRRQSIEALTWCKLDFHNRVTENYGLVIALYFDHPINYGRWNDTPTRYACHRSEKHIYIRVICLFANNLSEKSIHHEVFLQILVTYNSKGLCDCYRVKLQCKRCKWYCNNAATDLSLANETKHFRTHKARWY